MEVFKIGFKGGRRGGWQNCCKNGGNVFTENVLPINWYSSLPVLTGCPQVVCNDKLSYFKELNNLEQELGVDVIPLSTNPTKWSNRLKQFVGNSRKGHKNECVSWNNISLTVS